MADIFDVIADPTRRDLLHILLERYEEASDENGGDISVSELVAKLTLSQPTVSKHLKVLRDFHLVSVREQGQHRFYRLDIAPLEIVKEWLTPFLGDAEIAPEEVPEIIEAPIDMTIPVEAESTLSAGVAAFASAIGSVLAGIQHATRVAQGAARSAVAVVIPSPAQRS